MTRPFFAAGIVLDDPDAGPVWVWHRPSGFTLSASAYGAFRDWEGGAITPISSCPCDAEMDCAFCTAYRKYVELSRRLLGAP